ncbi:hypothetical protein Taro_016836 [Colocasia esculenta]|uniref:Uncharacterized protein n=1 Tax=Colocasia esculenta TaxID=4460 RepID=A0A843UPK3_COLES|nr:hypothetical protein [Colocasia esculenta]
MKPSEGGSPAQAALPRNSKSSTPKSAAASSDERPRKVGAYAMQCAKCFKFRSIATQEEYEEIRRNFIEEPWLCSRKENVSCDDPADMEFDTNALWVIDKPNLPKTPAGCQRILVMRKDLSKMDATYVMPNGKRMRSNGDVEKFLEAFPEYKGQFSVSDFSFTVPKIMEGMVPGKSGERGSANTGKRVRNEDMED